MKKFLPLLFALLLPAAATAQPTGYAEWSELMKEQEAVVARCVKERTLRCVMVEIIRLREPQDGVLDLSGDNMSRSSRSIDGTLLQTVVMTGDAELAKRLLPLMPAGDRWRKMQLLFTAGEDKAAEEMLQRLRALSQQGEDVGPSWYKRHRDDLQTAMQERASREAVAPREGDDFGAVWALLRRGDPDKAQKIATLTADWFRDPPDPPYYGESECGLEHFDYAASLTALTMHFLSRKQFDRAEEIAALIEKRMNDERLRKNYPGECKAENTRRAFFDIHALIAAAYHDAGKQGEARKHMERLSITYRIPVSVLARALVNAGMQAEALTAGDSVAAEKAPSAENWEANNHNRFYQYDRAAVIYARAGGMDRALARIETLSPLLRMNTLRNIAREAVREGRMEDGKRAAEAMLKYAGQREDDLYGDFYDRLQIVQLLADLGMVEEARKELDTAKKSSKPYYWMSPDQGMRANVATIYARLGDWKSLEEWVRKFGDQMDFNYSKGNVYSDILAWFAKREDWQGFDKALSYGALFRKVAGMQFSIDDGVKGILIEKKQFVRYRVATEIEMREGSISYRARDLFLAGLTCGIGADDATMTEMGKEFAAYCPYYDRGNTRREVLRGCYAQMLDEYRRQYAIRLKTPSSLFNY